MNEGVHVDLFNFEKADCRRKRSAERRRNPLFLRNQFVAVGKWGISFVRKQQIDLSNVGLISCTNTTWPDDENFDLGVHFFVDDFRFNDIYEHPEKSLQKFKQYRFCCTPDCSVYGEMPPWRQLESVAHSRWIGAWWQSQGMTIVPTISWDAYSSYEFCFDGVEEGSVVAVATYACRQNRSGFLRGYVAMIERIHPEAVICYGDPFPEMSGHVISVHPQSPRGFHREIPLRRNGQ